MIGEREELRGVGITRCEDGFGLKINLSERDDLHLPSEIDGVPVQVEIVGEIRALRTTRVTRRRTPRPS
jgi:PII-like signaling protein